MMKQRHLEEAEAMMPASFAEHSAEYLDGFRYALAWALAGQRGPTEGSSKDTMNHHAPGTPERDAWFYGWGNGFRHAQRAGLIPAD